jgi:hypothetical protein
MPRLICNVTTPQEMREEMVSLLLHRAAQQTAQQTISKTMGVRNMHEHAALVLGNLAGEVKCMKIINLPAQTPADS